MNKTIRRYMASAVAEEIKDELYRGEDKYGPFHSLHEGLAVLREEYAELEQEIFWGAQRTGSMKGVRAEAIQVAAVAMRIVMTVGPIFDNKESVTDAELEVD